MSFAGSVRRWWRRHVPPAAIPEELWRATLAAYPFLARLTLAEQARLLLLATLFLDQKRFSGTHGLVVTDAMAVAVAAQACVLLLHLDGGHRPEAALRWYDDFVGIVLYPGAAVARRERVDHAGVVHAYDQVIDGEAMQHGPVMLSWSAVRASAMGGAGSVVIHEFAHKLDMRSGGAHGAPPLPRGFLGTRSDAAAAALWKRIWAPAYRDFRRAVARAERGFDRPTWLNPYAASAPEEFFAVACEAYFMDPEGFGREFPLLRTALHAFFSGPGSPASAHGG